MFGSMVNPKYDVLPMVSICERSGQYGSNTSACDYISGTPRYIRITDINDDGSLNDDIKSAEAVDDKYLLKDGDLVFARTGATVGKTYLHHSGKAIYAGYLIKYHPIESLVNPEYLFAYTHSSPYYAWVELTKKVGAQPNISATQYDELPVILPPIDKQNEFVMIARQADKSKFDGFKSQFIEMFGGDKVEHVELSSVCSTFIDGDWIESKDQSESGIRLIQTGNVGCGEYKDKEDKAKFITEETFNRLHCSEIFPGDILISRLPDPVGRSCILPDGLGKCITAVDCTIIKLSDIMLPKFFVAYTNSPDYLAQIKNTLAGTTRLRVSRGNLGKVKIPLPSIEQQTAFVTIAEQADKSKSVCRQAIKRLVS